MERETAFPECRTTLGPGDVVVLFTDGVSESEGPDESYFGVEGVQRCMEASAGSAEDVGEAILREVRAHSSGRPRSDDIALVAFGRE